MESIAISRPRRFILSVIQDFRLTSWSVRGKNLRSASACETGSCWTSRAKARSSMQVEAAEWVEKAEGDWHTAGRELRATEFPNYDAVCFHAQQCAEKYLKALLTERDVRFPKMHHLPTLLDLLVPVCP